MWQKLDCASFKPSCNKFRIVLVKRSIFLDLEEGAVKTGDVIIVEGQFRNRIAQLRFISKSTSCIGGVPENSGRVPQCHPLVVRFYPRRKTVSQFLHFIEYGYCFIQLTVELQVFHY